MTVRAAKNNDKQKHRKPKAKPKPWFSRWSGWIMLVFAIAAPGFFYGAFQAVCSNQNQVSDWLPASFNETDELAWYKKNFVGDQFVVLSWDGCTIDGDTEDVAAIAADPRIDKLASLLVSNSPVGGRADARPYQYYFKSVVTGPRMLEYLVEPPSSLSYKLAKKRLGGSLFGPDNSQTCLVVTLSDDALLDLGEVLSRPTPWLFGFNFPAGVIYEAIKECGIEPDQARLGGPPVDNVAIDEEGERSFARLVGISALLGLILAWASLRSLRLTMIVFACGILSATASLATLWVTGTNTDAIVLSMPPLVYVLAISGAVHLINYYLEVINRVGPLLAPGKAILLGWRPAFYCSVTTALGLMSLCTSEITPIRKFGFFSALGVLEMLAVLFLFLPAALSIWPVLPAAIPKSGKTKSKQQLELPASTTRLGKRFWELLGTMMVRHHALVTFSFMLLLLGFASGLQHFRTSIDLMKLFDSKARILSDYRWLESHVGRLVPVEVVLCFAPDSIAPMGVKGDDDKSNETTVPDHRWTLLDRINMVAQAQRKIEEAFGSGGSGVIGPTMSALSFIAPLPQKDRSLGAFVHRRLMNRKLEDAYGSISQSGYLAIDQEDGSELWRISIRVAAFENVDYGEFSDSLSQLIDPVVESFARSKAPMSNATASLNPVVSNAGQHDVKAVYTGVIPIVYKAQAALLSSLVSSTIWSFLTITPLLMFISRGIFAGMVAMIPNVLPVLVVFGGLSWLGMPIDIGSMMAASIALGVAVDDTIHFLTWFRVSLDKTGDRHQAILSAYQHCATPTMQATLVNGLGLSVFTFSSFVPTKQLGFLMLVILFAGAAAELLLLPAILAGPMGAVFKPAKPTIETQD